MTLYLVTPNVRHLTVRAVDPKPVADARETWGAGRPAYLGTVPLCGRPMPRSAREVWSWGHLPSADLEAVIDSAELRRVREARRRPTCSHCAATLERLILDLALR